MVAARCRVLGVMGGVTAGIISIGGHDTRVAVKLVLPTDVAGNEDVGVAARRETAALAHATRHVPAAVLALKGFLDAGNFMIAQEVPGSSLINHLQKLIKEQAGLKASAWVRPPPPPLPAVPLPVCTCDMPARVPQATIICITCITRRHHSPTSS